MHGKVVNDVDIMVLFAPCVDDNTLATIHVNLLLRLVTPFLSCLPAFYALAIPMSCYISNVFYYLYIIVLQGSCAL